MALPTEPSPGRREQARTLQALDGPAFDACYMSMAVTEHRQSLDALKKAERASWDAGFKQFAADTLAVVADHLAQAERLASATGTGQPAKR